MLTVFFFFLGLYPHFVYWRLRQSHHHYWMWKTTPFTSSGRCWTPSINWELYSVEECPWVSSCNQYTINRVIIYTHTPRPAHHQWIMTLLFTLLDWLIFTLFKCCIQSFIFAIDWGFFFLLFWSMILTIIWQYYVLK